MDSLPYVLKCINDCLFQPQLISLSTRLYYKLSNPNYNITAFEKDLHIMYPSVHSGYSDQIKMRDYAYPLVECWFYGTESRIILRNNKIQFMNGKITHYFKYEADFEQDINEFDLNDVFALSTIINGTLSKDLISTLIDEYKQLRKNKSNIFMHIQRYK